MTRRVSSLWSFPIWRAALTALSIGFLQTPTPAQDRSGPKDDYLVPQLRTRVEALKKDVAAQPSTAQLGPGRARVLWDWANAFALDGNTLPVDLPSTITRILGPAPPSRGSLAAMDRFIRELTLREERPSALGTLTTDTKGPFAPGSYVTIRQTYRFGDARMTPRGGFLVARHFMSNQGAFQADRPKGDNYITIRSSNPKARFVAGTRQMGGMHGGFRRAAPGLFFRLEDGTLEKGDTVTITYGDRSGGSRGFQVQTYSNNAFPLPLYIDLSGHRELLTLPLQTYEVGGGPVHSVRAFAPSVVKAGEPFTISVRSEDFYYNRANGPVPEYEVKVNGETHSTLPAGKEAIRLIENVAFEEPGVYRIAVTSADGAVRGEGNPVWVRDNPERRVYWGDTHGHCGFAEGQGTPDAFFTFGRDDARLDFLTLYEHDLWMDDSEWETLLEMVDKYNVDGKFVAIPGYEWTVGTRWGGHHNVFFRNTTDRKRVPNQTAPVLSKLYRDLANGNDMRDVLVIPHAHSPGEYRVSDANMEHLVEIMSMHGHFEWFGIMYLEHGHEVGFVAASDDHLSHPGYSTPLPGGLAARGGLGGVWAPEKTRDAIFDAMKDLSAYATTGQRIILDVKVNGARMGTRTTSSKVREIRGRVIGTAPIDRISIIKNGEEIRTEDLLTATEVPENGAPQSLEVSFHSTTDPGIRDSPRGWRPWRGSVKVTGARLKRVSSPALQNRLSEFVRRDDSEPGRAEFSLITRGAAKNLVLELEDLTDGAAVEIDLSPARERPSTPASFREAARLPGATIRFAMEDLENGRAVHQTAVDRFTDTVMLRRIRTDAPLDHEFGFTDEKDARIGDYYFVRVTQLDGGVAWASPVWVGGFSPRHER
jgi:hypothetical protein